jgi:hypothetical protein
MRHTILIATLSSVAASVLTTVVIGGSLFGAGTASSADAPSEAIAVVSPGGVEGLIQGDVDCQKDVTPVDSLKVLRHDAGLSVQQDEPCPDIATVIPAGEGVPGPQGPQGPAGPAGPKGEQGPPGINLWATVRADGTFMRGTATGASQLETGLYLVTFDQDVDKCAPMANPGLTEAGMSFADDAIASTVTAAFLGVGENQVAVIFQTPLDRIDTDFHLIVVC